MKRNAMTLPLKPAAAMPAKAEGEALMPGTDRDETAYARDIGTFLQQFHLFAADWIGARHESRDSQAS